MADLSTTYMGIKLSSPVVVGASTFSKYVDNIKKAEDLGAGAMVIHSLFQEEMELEARELGEELQYGADHYSESLTYLPQMDFAGPREHIMWIEKARKEVRFPLIGSLNATHTGNWVDYAKQLENAGCNALELNLYSIETEPNRTCSEIESQTLDTVAAVKQAVGVPVAVKLSPWYTSVASFAAAVVDAGADGLVLFNRFYQPIIDPQKQELKISLDLSTSAELRLPLRWIAILSGRIDTDLAASTGVHTGDDVIRQILAGAKAVQMVSALYQNGLDHILTVNRQISDWMAAHSYTGIEDFRGKVSKHKETDPYAFERAQYIKLLVSQK